MSVDENILERIRKVKRLAENAGTEGEAQAAICALQNLLTKYDLSAADVDLEDDRPEETVNQVVVDSTGARVHWRGWLGSVIAKNFRCEVFWSGYTGHQRLVFLGLESDVTCASAAYGAAVQTMTRLKEQYLAERAEQRRNGGLWFRESVSEGMLASKSFIAGFIQGLKSALQENVEKMALVLVRDARVDEAVHDLTLRRGEASNTRYHDDPNARIAGREAGASYGRAARTPKVGTGNSGYLNS